MGMKNSLALISAILVFAVIIGAESTSVTSNYEEAREVARQAYIFAFPMLENYRTMVLQAV
ncbi:MAG: hypothetical protein PWQ24_1424, partial [Mesotoga sp.]|nr:hypothetical protein [Mesotoga sp.]